PIRHARTAQAVLRRDERDALLHGVRVRGERDRGPTGVGARRHDGRRVGSTRADPRDLSHGAVLVRAASAARAPLDRGGLAPARSVQPDRAGSTGLVPLRTAGAVAGADSGSQSRRSTITPATISRVLVSCASVNGPSRRSSLARTISIRNRSVPASTR